MKELLLKKKDHLQVEVTKENKKVNTLIGSQKKVAGHTMFEYNEQTCELKLAVFMKSDFIALTDNYKDMEVKKKVAAHDHCIYFQKLNFQNAVKHLSKLGYSGIKIVK